MDFTTVLLIALGGALGTLGRHGLALAMSPISQSLPWGTIVINIAGCFMIGFFGSLTLAHGRFPLPEAARLFVMVGICGGFTTFSSFSLQTLDLLRSGAVARALTNVGVSVILCLLAVALGHMIGSRLSGGLPAVAQIGIEEEA